MTEERKAELYAALVREAEDFQKRHGRPATRFQALDWLDGLADLNRDTVDLVEKLYADGFVTE